LSRRPRRPRTGRTTTSPIPSAAKDWTDDHLPDTLGGWPVGTVIERHYFEPIYHGITADGLTIS
jgi:hypothetical protein